MHIIKVHKYTLKRISENTISIDCENKRQPKNSQTVIKYSNGGLGYDRPEELPFYIKREVRTMFNKKFVP